MTTVPNPVCPALSPAQRMLGFLGLLPCPVPKGTAPWPLHTPPRVAPKVLVLTDHTLLMLWVAGSPDLCSPGWTTLVPPYSQLSRAPPTMRGRQCLQASQTCLQWTDSRLHTQKTSMLTQMTPLRMGLRRQMHYLGVRPVRPHPTPAPDTLPAPNTSLRRPVDSGAAPGGPDPRAPDPGAPSLPAPPLPSP